MKKNTAIIFILIGVLIISISNNIFANNKENKLNIKTLDTTEAYNIALKKVKELNDKAELCFMTSVDNPQKKENDDGLDGERRFWNLDFAVPNTEQHYIVAIKDGKIADCSSVKSSVDNNSLIKDDKNILSSSNVLKKVLQDYSVKPGSNWANGYHFVIDIENGQCVLSVIATDNQSNMVRILVDTVSGEIISASRKIYKGGGIYSNGIKVDIPEASKYWILGISVSKVVSDTNSLITWGQMILENSKTTSRAIISNDDGKNWTNINLKGNILKMWFSEKDNSIIYAVVDKQLLLSKDNGISWTKLLECSDTIINTSSINNRIGVLTNNRIYISEDYGYSWNTIDNTNGVVNIEVGINNVIGFTGNELLQMLRNDWIKLDNPFNSDLLGIKVINDGIIAYSNNKIAFLKSGSNEWKSTDMVQELKNVFVNRLANNNYEIFCDTGGTYIYKLELSTGGDFIKWTDNKIILPQDGDLADLVSGQNGKMYYHMIPKQVWEKMDKER